MSVVVGSSRVSASVVLSLSEPDSTAVSLPLVGESPSCSSGVAPPQPGAPPSSTSARARRSAEAMLTRQHRLLQAISRAQAVFIASAKPEAAFDALLDELMELTRSSFGMVGHVQHTPGGSPTLHLHAMTDIRRDEATRMQTVRRLQQARVFDSTTPLVGQVLAHEQPVILEDASTDASCQPLPEGLPPLGACMALPIHAAQELVAVVVLANSHSGYGSADIQFLQPLLSTVGQLEMARRAEEDRRQVDAQLVRTSALLGEKTNALEATLASVSQGIVKVDADGKIRVFNQRYLELLELPREFMATEPTHEDIVRFQTERGDFDQGFELIEADGGPVDDVLPAQQADPHGVGDLRLQVQGLHVVR